MLHDDANAWPANWPEPAAPYAPEGPSAPGQIGSAARSLRPVQIEPKAMLPLADLTAWSERPATPKPFLMAGFVPANEVTLLTGPGGGNKSTFGQQLATCAAAGLPMLGVAVQPGKALYVTCEDDDDRLHWMQQHIGRALGVEMGDLAGNLFLSSLRGRTGNELASFDRDGKLQAEALYETLRATIRATGAGLVVLDNLAHLFVGNENDRGQVTAFVNLLYSLCRDLGATIILIGHPNKAGDSYSGSTAWLNAVRSQIVIERPEDAIDPDVRTARLGKANYARQGEALDFRWHDFALVRDQDLPADVREELEAVARDAHDNAVFLDCVDERNRQERPVSESPASRTYAPKVFAEMSESKRIGRARLEAAMDRLYRSGAIERGFVYRDTSEGKDRSGLRRPTADPSADHPLTGSADVPLTTRRPPPPHPSPLKGGLGAAPSEAAAPIPTSDPILAPGEAPAPGWIGK